jgi:hypothetical protein
MFGLNWLDYKGELTVRVVIAGDLTAPVPRSDRFSIRNQFLFFL